MRPTDRYTFRKLAERTYAWRVDVLVPAGGFGQRINAMSDWCAAELGRFGDRYAHHAAPRRRGEPEAVRYYFRVRAERDRFISEGVPAGLAAAALDRPELEDRSEGA